jgi:hypothetical protein
MATEFDFINDDIARLAIHVRESTAIPRVRPISFVKAGPGDKVLIPGHGRLVGYCVQEATGVAGTFALTDGPSAEQRYVALAAMAANAVIMGPVATNGLPFANELVIADLSAATSWTGQVFVHMFD